MPAAMTEAGLVTDEHRTVGGLVIHVPAVVLHLGRPVDDQPTRPTEVLVHSASVMLDLQLHCCLGELVKGADAFGCSEMSADRTPGH